MPDLPGCAGLCRVYGTRGLHGWLVDWLAGWLTGQVADFSTSSQRSRCFTSQLSSVQCSSPTKEREDSCLRRPINTCLQEAWLSVQYQSYMSSKTGVSQSESGNSTNIEGLHGIRSRPISTTPPGATPSTTDPPSSRPFLCKIPPSSPPSPPW